MFILDCSATMPWLLKNDKTGYAKKVLKQLITEPALVPKLWQWEVSNILLVSERRKKIEHSEALRFLNWLNLLPIETHYVSTDLTMESVYELGREYQLSSYDAVYLALASQKNLPIATLDKALRRAANKMAINVFD